MSIPVRTSLINNYLELEFQERLKSRFIKATGKPPVVLPPHVELIELNTEDVDVTDVVGTTPVVADMQPQHIYLNNGFEC